MFNGRRRFYTCVLAACVAGLLAILCAPAPAYAQGIAPAASCAGPGECLCDNSFENCRDALLQLIRNEPVWGGIDVSLWFLTDWRYRSEIIKRWEAGVPVRIIVDTRADSYAANKTERGYFVAAGIPIRNCVASAINHWKAMIFAAQGKVQFSAANFSDASLSPTTPYTGYLDEAIYFTDDPAIVNSFKKKFDDHWTNTSSFTNLANINAPLTRNYPEATTVSPDLNFVPDQDFLSRLRSQVLLEDRQIDAVIFRITSGTIPDALIARHNAGVPVRLITDQRQYRNPTYFWHSYNIDRMHKAGIDIRIKDDTSEQDMHQKSIILHNRSGRGSMVVFGSSNWTSSSSSRQREHNYFTTKGWMINWFKDQFERKWNNMKVDGTPIGAEVFRPLTPLPPNTPIYASPANDALGIGTSVVLSWEGGYWAHKYDIYLDTTPTFTAPVVVDYMSGSTAGVGSRKESYTFSNLLPGTTYYWRIVSKTMADVPKVGLTWRFTTAGGVAPPPAPTGLTGAATGSTSTALAWTDVAGEEGYKIERKLGSSTTWTQIAITAPDVTAYADVNSGLTATTAYDYRVRAFTTGGNSGYSNTVRVTTRDVGLSPNDVVLYAADATAVSGRWSVVADDTAAGGQRMSNPNDGASRLNTALAQPTHYFELQFPASAGRAYRLWMRGKATYSNPYNDSVHVQFSNSVNASGAAVYRIGTTSAVAVNLEDCSGCGLDGWGWQDTAEGVGVLGPVIYFAESGVQTLRVQVREDGASFDQIVLSPETFLHAAPGAAKRDSTILPRQAAPASTTPDTEAPSVSITAPANGVNVSGTVTVSTATSDDVGVVRAELWVDGARALTTQSSPFRFSWNSTSVNDGAHTLQVRAFDGAGNSGESSVISLIVSNPVGDDIILRAADATVVVGTWTVVADSSAAGGSRMFQPDAGVAKITAAKEAPTDYFELTFTAQAGTPYRLWIRGRAAGDDWANDSVHVQFTNSVDASLKPLFQIGTASGAAVNLEDCSGCGISGWGWQDNGWGVGVLGPEIRFATSGTQRIRIQAREDGFSIDQIVLSPGRFLSASPGSLKNDTTILR